MGNELGSDARRMDELQAELASALGLLVISFGRLEHAVSELVAACFGRVDGCSSQSIDAVLSFRQKLDLVAAMAPYRLRGQPENLVQVQYCVQKLGEIEARRNSLLHSFWAWHPDPQSPNDFAFRQTRNRTDRKKGLRYVEASADVQSIRELTAEIEHWRRLFGANESIYEVARIMEDAAHAQARDESFVGPSS
jgi:hypothetical protein